MHVTEMITTGQILPAPKLLRGKRVQGRLSSLPSSLILQEVGGRGRGRGREVEEASSEQSRSNTTSFQAAIASSRRLKEER